MKVLFVCTGNICRSPLAEGILKSKFKTRNINGEVASCGFEPFHIGDHADSRAQKIARANGIDISNHIARLFHITDFDRFDQIYVMDSSHFHSVTRMARNDQDRKKIDYIMNVITPGHNQHVKDPYYDQLTAFDTVFKQLDQACEKIADIASSRLKK